MIKYLPHMILIYYLALLISTIYLLMKNIGPSMDVYALIFQISILVVCVLGIVGTLLNYKFSIRYNHYVIFIFSFLFGLALLNAIFFGELHLISIREVILYLLLIVIDYLMIKDLINKNKIRSGSKRL